MNMFESFVDSYVSAKRMGRRGGQRKAAETIGWLLTEETRPVYVLYGDDPQVENGVAFVSREDAELWMEALKEEAFPEVADAYHIEVEYDSGISFAKRRLVDW